MQNNVLELLLRKAKEVENEYEWLQATELYQKAADLALKQKDPSEAAELQERLGFCFHRAAFQAQTNVEFRKLLQQAIQAYEKESKILERAKDVNKQIRIDHAHALVAYTRSWLETTPSKKKELNDRWWNLEKKVLEAYEASGDLHSVGRTCNNLVEWNSYDRFHLEKNFAEKDRIFKETIYLVEKSIQALSKIDDKYELARAYCSYGGYYGTFEDHFKDEDKILEFAQRCRDYANKALELSKEIGDTWLIGRSYISAASGTQVRADPVLFLKLGENILKTGNIVKDNLLIGWGKTLKSISKFSLYVHEVEPDKARATLKEAAELAEEATHNFQIIDHAAGLAWAYHSQSLALEFLASYQTNPKKRQELLEITNKVIQEGLEKLGEGRRGFVGLLYFTLCINIMFVSLFKKDLTEKRKLLQKAEYIAKKSIPNRKEKGREDSANPMYFLLSSVQKNLANTETDKKKKIRLLNSAASYEEKYVKKIEKKKKIYAQSAFGGVMNFGVRYISLGDILRQIYFLTKEQRKLRNAIETYKKAIKFYKSADFHTRVAELYWRVAQLNDLQGEQQESSQNYELAAEAYDRASKKISSLKQFYENYASYMRAWSQIEQARSAHSIEDYDKAREHYEKAAEFHESTDKWNYLTSNYLAWANVEEAEGLSRREEPQQSKQVFQKAYEQFSKAEESIEQKLDKFTRDIVSFFSLYEREMIQRLLKASDLRRRYCQARILLEDAKLLDREGKYLQSSKGYREAAQNLSSIIEKVDVEAERKELELLCTLCRAWEKMATAEEKTSSESFLEAAMLFEQAKDRCFTRKASLWALGNSNFCRGLAAGVQYQTTLDLTEHAKAKGYIKNAGTNYLQAGFKSASEYAKATQRLFDAYVFMNQAEREVDQEKRAKQYQMAENLLQIAAGSFLKAKQPEKTGQVQQILRTVGEEKALAVSLTEVMRAPTVTSSTFSFTAPTPTNESSVGLESFEHANVQANMVAATREVKVGESFCLSIEFVNAGREPALLTRVENFIPRDFIVVNKPEIYRLEENCLNMKGKQLAPLKLVEAKLVLQPSKKGLYQLQPTVHYLDELGQPQSLQLKSVEIKVEEIILADRVSTGTKELDSLLLGGFPEGYAVVLTGSPSDERDYLIKNFLEAGVQEEQTSFYVTAEAVGFESLFEKSGFYLFLCNPKPKIKVSDLPNITWLKSKTDLNNLNMALVRASRNVQQKQGVKRIVIGNVSDVLLKDGAEVTRRWLSELVTDLGSKGFTVLAVVNPLMHGSEELNAVLDLFDGEISLTQAEDLLECGKCVVVRKLRNQDFIKNSICLTEQN